MSIVKTAISKLTNTIPIQLLTEAFTYDYLSPYRKLKDNSYLPLETHIEDEVWSGLVYHDINNEAGQSLEIDIGGISPRPYSHTRLGSLSGLVFHVPESRRDGRNIISISTSSTNMYNLGGNISPNNTGRTLFENLSNKLLDHTVGVSGVTTPPTLAFLGGNNILVYGNYLMFNSLRVRCELENDKNLQNFQRNYANKFYLLIEQATKMLIFNRLALHIDQAKISGGFELGRFRDIVDGYSDADKLYQEQLEEWGKVALFNDDEAYLTHLNLISGGIG